MSLTLALNNALSGINVSQRSLSVLANNVANANTPGYSRQKAEISPNVAGYQGVGARVEQIVRTIDTYLNRAVQNQSSATGYSMVVADYMERAQIMMGSPGGTNSIDEHIESFFNIMQSLAETPELTSFRYQAVNSGVILARELSTLAHNLEDLRLQADRDLRAGFNVVNNEIRRLDEINESIYRAAAMGESTANLLDQRDIALGVLAEYMDVSVNEFDSGQVYVYTTGGVPLVEHVPYQISYSGVHALETLLNKTPLPQVTIDGVREDGSPLGRPQVLVSSGVSQDITTVFKGGKLKGYLDLRDHELPNMLAQLDQIAARLRDELNALHNSGSGVPGASQLTGTRPLGYSDASEWTGTARIAVVNPDGTAVNSRYNNSDMPLLALDLDFDSLRSQYGDLLTTDTIIKEINSFFASQNKVEVGNMNNITLAALSDTVEPGSPFVFDFQMENISGTNSNLWVQDIRVENAAGADVTSVSSTAPAPFTIASLGTMLDSTTIAVTTTAPHGLAEGETIFLDSIPGGMVNGIPVSELNGHAFRVTNVTATGFDIEVTEQATATGVVASAGTGQGAYATQMPGVVSRGGNGEFTLNLPAGASEYYTVYADVMVEDDNGNISVSTVEYRILNDMTGTFNNRYPPRSATGDGTVHVPHHSQPLMQAQLVNDRGLPANSHEKGYLQLTAMEIPGSPGTRYTISIDDLSSREVGRPNDVPVQVGSGRGFSHFFELNNFFVSNKPSARGDTVAGSAYNMAVREDIVTNPNLISTGTLTRTPTTGMIGEVNYSYERTAGGNSVAQAMAKLGIKQVAFDAAGGLPTSSKSFNSYASEVLGFAAGKAANATSRYSDDMTLLGGFSDRAQAVSGVNIDEEMANTIIYQNSYSASAQVLRTVKDLFDVLLASF